MSRHVHDLMGAGHALWKNPEKAASPAAVSVRR